MKRKKVAKLMAVVTLIGAVGVGGSLALLTAQTEEVSNTFTVGDGLKNTDIELDETNVDKQDGEQDRDKTNIYYDIQPNTTITKDPQVRLVNSNKRADAYVFIRVSGCDEFMNAVNNIDSEETPSSFKNWNDNWKMIAKEDDNAKLDGIYVYSTDDSFDMNKGGDIVKGSETFSQYVFEGINLSKDANLYAEKSGQNVLEKNQIVIDACAVQAAGDTNTWANAVESLPTDFVSGIDIPEIGA